MEPKTSEESAYEKLRHLIIRRQLPVNEFLSQRMLAELAGVAVVTVRGALRYLENEGLIENVPKWGVRIPVEGEESLRDRYFMREVLEVVAVQRVLEQNNPTHFTLLKGKAQKCDDVAREDPTNTELFADIHFDLHHSLAECSGSKLLVETLDRLQMRTMMFWNAQRGWARGYSRFQHVKLIEDLFNNDETDSEQIIRDHIRLGLGYELEAIKS